MINNLISYIKNDDYMISIYEKNIYIFNYERILNVNINEIKIKLKNKRIIIKGNDLFIKKLENKELLINGFIKGLDFNE